MDNPQNTSDGKGEGEKPPIENVDDKALGDSLTPESIVGGLVAEGQAQPGSLDAPWGLRADGTPRKKPGRRLKSEAVAVPADGSVPAPIAAPAKRTRTKLEQKASEVSSQQIARMIFASFAVGMSNLVGPEWNPESQEEADGMRAAIAAYVDAKSEGKLSPDAMLAFAILGYSAARLGHENTQTKFGKLAGKIWGLGKSAFKRIFGV